MRRQTAIMLLWAQTVLVFQVSPAHIQLPSHQWRFRKTFVQIKPVWAAFFWRLCGKIVVTAALAWVATVRPVQAAVGRGYSNTHPVWDYGPRKQRAASVCVSSVWDQDKQGSTWADLRHKPLSPVMSNVPFQYVYLFCSYETEFRLHLTTLWPRCLLLLSFPLFDCWNSFPVSSSDVCSAILLLLPVVERPACLCRFLQLEHKSRHVPLGKSCGQVRRSK